jgi:hypothetical protein
VVGWVPRALHECTRIFSEFECIRGCFQTGYSSNVLGTVLKTIVAATLPFLALGFGSALLATLTRARTSDTLIAFLVGAVAFVPVWLGYRRQVRFFRRLGFFMTFEHEVTHLIVGLLFFKGPESFRASGGEGGEVRLYGNNFVIKLAPYFLPTLALPFLLIPAILLPAYEPISFGLLGFVVAYHIFSTIHETSPRQPDIKESGYVFSALFLPVANVICYGTILAFALEGYDGIVRLWIEGLGGALNPLLIVGGR